MNDKQTNAMWKRLANIVYTTSQSGPKLAPKGYQGKYVISFFCTDLTLSNINEIAALFHTEEISFNFGSEGEPRYSDVTPGSPERCGSIEVYFSREDWTD